MSLVTSLTSVIQAIAADVKQLKSQAANGWSVVTTDPVNAPIGFPWLLQTAINPPAFLTEISAGFGYKPMLYEIAQAYDYHLSVNTKDGIGRVLMTLD